MLRHINRSGALVVAALVAALASSSYAAGVLPLSPASVGRTQLKSGAVSAVKIAAAAATSRAVRDGTLLRRDIAPAASLGQTGSLGSAGRTGAVGQRGPVGPVGARGPTGPRGPAGVPGSKGATGVRGQAPIPQHYFVFTHPGFIHIPANAEQTATLACPEGTRVISGGPTDDFVIAGAPVRPHTLMASVPNTTGTGWVVTIKAGATAYDLEIGATCIAVD